jgi:hypothetical protein
VFYGDWQEKLVMSKRHPKRNSQFIKVIGDVYYFFEEETFKIKNNLPVIPHTAMLACVNLQFKRH